MDDSHDPSPATRLKAADADRLLARVEAMTEEIVDLSARMIRVPTVNPPGENYVECAEVLGGAMRAFDFEVETIVAEDAAEHSDAYPRVNVIGLRDAGAGRPLVHVNGHLDVVPVGEGWTEDPFGGVVKDGKLYGRGSADMKAGLVCGLFAAEALRREGVQIAGSVEVSGTADEESGGFAGVAHLAQIGRLSAERIDYAIIPEPFEAHRICIGHRGVYWFKVIAQGHIGHGSMPFLGTNAIAGTGPLLEAVRRELEPRIATRVTSLPVVPEGAQRATINVNAILGGQGGEDPQTPCVADRCETIFDRRFLPEEGFEATRAEIEELLRQLENDWPDVRFELEDMMTVHPTQTPDGSPLVAALERGVEHALGRTAEIVASPGTYDQKHFSRIGGVHHCVAYGPGVLEQAHQPDEWCSVEEMVRSTQVMALAIADLLRG
ncbi:MAG: acetylornithine deacetylase/succinyl-diaminopimelate desuccinylase family protein [Acidobacteriota bacterium]